ncbi:MAG: noncanonical pyrimidine nucleotidase, YjjG family [Flavobacteriaceae bacterium]|nr:noncanonical pyrimidine nucleotidase, YjjG family [Flavobacteriaceae bacterium]
MLPLDKIKHIFFDLDHTLWDFDKNSEITYGIIFKKRNIDLLVDKFLEIYLPINTALWKLYRDEKIDKYELRYERLRQSFDAMNYPIEDDVINTIAEDYIFYLSKQKHLIVGAMDLLEYLKPKYKLHIITNGFQEVQNHKLNNSELASFFDVIVNSEMAGVKKPHPQIFELALKKANANLEDSIMIGDSLEADVYGALQYGFDAILFDYHNDKEASSDIKIVKELKEIKQYL